MVIKPAHLAIMKPDLANWLKLSDAEKDDKLNAWRKAGYLKTRTSLEKRKIMAEQRETLPKTLTMRTLPPHLLESFCVKRSKMR